MNPDLPRHAIRSPETGASTDMREIRRALAWDALDQRPEAIHWRFRWARENGHPAYVWPDVRVASWRACVRAIELATAGVLAQRVDPAYRKRPRPVRLPVPAGSDPHAMGVAAFSSGMGPLLGAWIERGELRTERRVAAVLALHLVHGRVRYERMMRALDGALNVLEQAGVEVTLLKGAHTAAAYFPEPGVRPIADLDLVVPPSAREASERALRAAGYIELKRQARPYKSDWLPPGVPRTLRSVELTHAENPFTVEMHDALERHFFGVRRIDLGPVETAGVPRPGGRARVLEQPVLLAYLCLHAAEDLHQLQLLRLVEIVRVVRQDSAAGALDWRSLHHLLESVGALRFAYPALELAERLAPGTIDPRLRAEARAAASARMRRIVADVTPGTAQRFEALSLEERFVWAAGPVETARRAASLLWPARDAGSLRRIYADRWFRLLRGRVSVRGGPMDPSAQSARDDERGPPRRPGQ